MGSRIRIGVALVIVAIAARPATAQTTYTWGTNAATDWATGANWVGGTPAGSSSLATNNDIAQFGAGATGTQIQMDFGALGTPYYLGTINILGANTVAKTMGASTATAGVVQLNGTGANNLILSNASASLFTLAPLAGGSGTGMSLRLTAASSEVSVTGTGGIAIASVIGETGSGKAITKTGSGTLTLSGANTFSGGATLSGGGLTLGNDAALGMGTLTVGAIGTTITVTGTAATFANNIALPNLTGRINFNTPTASNTTLSGTISGGVASSSISTASGTEWYLTSASGVNSNAVTITGNNTGWQGTLTASRGPVILGSATAAGGTVIRLDSNLPATGALQLAGNFTIANSVYLTSGSAQTVGVGSGLSAGISGTVAGSGTTGLTKVGAGTLTLTGTNTYTNTTTVAAGTLLVSNTSGSGTGTGAVTVASGATLGGTGTISGPVTVQTGATVRGDSGTGTGTLTTGNLTLTGGSGTTGATLATQLTTDGNGAITANSVLAVGSNTFNLNASGGRVNIRLLNDAALQLNSQYTITLVTGGSGSFLRNGTAWNATTNPYTVADFNVISGSGAFTFSTTGLTVDGSNNLVLTFTPVPEPVTVLAVGAAGLGLVGLLRRRRKATATE